MTDRNNRRALQPRERVAFPLDVADLAAATEWVRLLRPSVGVFKVGLELFSACGPAAIEVAADGAACFLDLKLHDIPATMAKAAAAAANQGVRYLTVHAAAGPAALREAQAAVAGSDTQLLAVTVLTSIDIDTLRALGIEQSPADRVQLLARLAFDCGIHGFVCSPAEASALRSAFPETLLVTPGIRPAGTSTDDQLRTATPKAALHAGADVLVVGRPIRNAANPASAAAAILREIELHP